MLAHDTRSSAAALCQAAAAGIAAVGGSPEQPQLLTTPQLHWMVAHRNRDQPCSEADYYGSLLGAFEQLVSTFCTSASAQVCQPDLPPPSYSTADGAFPVNSQVAHLACLRCMQTDSSGLFDLWTTESAA